MGPWHLSLLLAALTIYDFVPASQGEINPMIIKQVKKLRMRCLNQTGASEELMDHSVQNRLLPNDPGVKCFLHCMFDMFGLIDSQNIMHLESLVEVLPEEIHDTIIGLVGACGTKKGKDGCETAYETVKCYIDVNGKFIWKQMVSLLG
ncbi:general odorant-binding protein 69a isoform X2 [Drosophila subpulchrella]|uniref:general odorant-binding protein 69a isoform X2 n=1 Tax=Drosophila subpulchrella TaxID=1486046 RepID=UPI0018A152C5|nr:general odorant-binding protein 69a isoform X2 [Drosophila subpulchrella]